jgi:hypothetical protein
MADRSPDVNLVAGPDADTGQADSVAYVPPHTPVEKQLTQIFEELLGAGPPGIHDTFFEMNGFSLLATQLAARIYEIYNVELTLRDVFESPTIEGLAQLVIQAQAGIVGTDQVAAILDEIE